MKRLLVLSSLVLVLVVMATIYLGGERTTLAYGTAQTATPSSQVVKTPALAAYPGPNVAPAVATPVRSSPTLTPSQQPASSNSASVLRSTIAITRTDIGSPRLTIISNNLPPTSSITMTALTLRLPGSPLSAQTTFAPSRPQSPAAPGDLVDNWEIIMQDNFDGATFPNTSSCVLKNFINPTGPFWGQDTLRATSGTKSIWPARSGANAVDPATNNYPINLDSWFVCGPYSFTNAKTLMAHYQRWIDIPDLDQGDFQFIGASTDGSYFNGVLWYGVQQTWVDQTVWFEQYEGQPQVWVALVFRSDNDSAVGKGAWIDDLKIWRYNNRSTTCAARDPGNKGLVLPAYESISNAWYPVIRSGEVRPLSAVIESNVRWTRLPFIQRDGYGVDIQVYDRMVDSLCSAGTNVLGLVNHETIPWNGADINSSDPAKAQAYRNALANQAQFLATHFNGRIKYWEVWNEPNYQSPSDPNHLPFLSAQNYAALLTTVYNAIKTGNSNAKVLFGGLAHGWDTTNNYFTQVYDSLDNEQGHARPFDYFAIHPYYSEAKPWGYGLDPQDYMHVITETHGAPTILDKFNTTMTNRQDPNKKMWITEIGWNSAANQPGLECLTRQVTTELEQANYLKKGFDILFHEVPNVEKVIWYQYIDGNTYACGTSSPSPMVNGQRVAVTSGFALFPSALNPWRFGLYGPEETHRAPKPSQCAFAAYPGTCASLYRLYLPLILR